MIQVIGVKRVAILLVLISVNAALAAGLYLYAIPEKENLARKLRSLRSKVSSVQTEIDRIKVEFAQLDKQQA